MDENEQYVRERWEVYVWQSDGHEHFIDLLNSGNEKHGAYTFPAKTLAAAWSAARAFTEGREKQIADRESDIEWLRMLGQDARLWTQHGTAILARERAALDELKRGMKA
jgi:hypothetical protein